MRSETRVHPLLKAADIGAMHEGRHVHRFNAAAVRHEKSLGDAVGLTGTGVHLVRVAPGDESTELHLHHQDEEWIYVLSGRGVAEIGSERCEIGPGDFMGFVAGSLPHAMRNPYAEDLVYLMGGSRNRFDVCDYPRIGKRRYRVDGTVEIVDLEAISK